jgi:hypothetical protein
MGMGIENPVGDASLYKPATYDRFKVDNYQEFKLEFVFLYYFYLYKRLLFKPSLFQGKSYFGELNQLHFRRNFIDPTAFMREL